MKGEFQKLASVILIMAMMITGVSLDGLQVSAATKKPTKITLNAKSKTLTVGKSFQLKVKSVKPTNASKSVTYKSSKKSVATVSSKGKIVAKKAGKTTITVTSKTNKKVKATCIVTVKKKVISTQKVTPTKRPTLTKKQTPTKKLTVTSKPTVTPEVITTIIPEPTLPPNDEETFGDLHNPVIDEDGNVTYSCIYFGNYPQSDATGQTKDPIKWRVLSINGSDAFLVADQNLDVMEYNKTYKAVTWETCTMRSWLNGYGSDSNEEGINYSSDNFIDKAFNDAEQAAILTTNIVNDDNPEYGTEGGNDTKDKIFLLSIEEVSNSAYGFFNEYSDSEARKRTNTAYVAAGGTISSSDIGSAGSTAWLRSPGRSSWDAARILDQGSVFLYGNYVDLSHYSVCPALHINLLSSSVWNVAENVMVQRATPKPTATPEPTATATPEPTLSPYGEGTPSGLHNPVIDEDGNVTYSCIYFGHYPQSDATGEKKDLIKWRILSINGSDAFLVADQNLDVMEYNKTEKEVTWETCTIRSWLNGYGSDSNEDGIDYSSDNFIDRAFNRAEQAAILTSTVVTGVNYKYGNKGGNNTQDKIFLLSEDEVRNNAYGFLIYYDSDRNFSEARKRTNTAYVAAGGTIRTPFLPSVGCNSRWWLRTQGFTWKGAEDVQSDGSIYNYGNDVHSNVSAVCPALHMNLSSSSVWGIAESVTVQKAMPTLKPTATLEPTATTKPTLPPYGEGKPSDLHNPVTDEDGNVTYSCIYFGNYPQSDATGKKKDPVKWRVLSINGDDAFLVADQNLDVMEYNKTEKLVTWETCTIRSWLNGYGSNSNGDGVDYSSNNFIDRAFNRAEQAAILTTNVVNKDNPAWGTEGGNDTKDKIFLLSIDDVSNSAYGFLPYKDFDTNYICDTRQRTNTAYVAAGGSIDDAPLLPSAGCTASSWLRSPGGYGKLATVNSSYIDRIGYNVDDNDNAVCPALHINLSSTTVWSIAEDVTFQRAMLTLEPIATPTPILLPNGEGEPGDLHNPATDENGNVTYSCIYFGNYPQSDATGQTKDPIKWRVLSIKGNDAFLVADQNLDVMEYNKTYKAVNWEKCTMRSWLNGYGSDSNGDGIDYSSDNFIDRAFNDAEQTAILTSTVVNKDNPEYATKGGNNTRDKIFLLSIDEVSNSAYGFLPYINSATYYVRDVARQRTNTDYVNNGGTIQSEWMKKTAQNYVEECGGYSWMLRSPGDARDYAAYVTDYGSVLRGGYSVNYNSYAVCPALHINLSSSAWSIAESVMVQRVTPTPTLPSYGEGKPSDLHNPVADSNGNVTYSCIYFGNYPQSDTTGQMKDPIKWRVLSVNGDDAFLVADQNLDVMEYNKTNEDENGNWKNVTWETCTMRSWLNGYGSDANGDGIDYSSDNFIDKAFNDAEQAAILTTNVINDDNPEYGTEGGNNTLDKIFLLSIDEVGNSDYGFLPCKDSNKYYVEDVARKRTNTDYANNGGTIQSEWVTEYAQDYVESYGSYLWWLRSPGYYSGHATYVYNGGYINRYGYVYNSKHAVCPVLHINLSSASVWSVAESVKMER